MYKLKQKEKKERELLKQLTIKKLSECGESRWQESLSNVSGNLSDRSHR